MLNPFGNVSFVLLPTRHNGFTDTMAMSFAPFQVVTTSITCVKNANRTLTIELHDTHVYRFIGSVPPACHSLEIEITMDDKNVVTIAFDGVAVGRCEWTQESPRGRSAKKKR
jgi:hypothetical protein